MASTLESMSSFVQAVRPSHIGLLASCETPILEGILIDPDPHSSQYTSLIGSLIA